MIIESASERYEVERLVRETSTYRVYLCQQQATHRQCLLQVAVTTQHNGDLDRGSYFLRYLEQRATEAEAVYAGIKTDPNMLLNYQLHFPELLDTFICREQGDRRINILAFRNVEGMSQMVPLSSIVEKDHLRIDLRTSAWILGKLLKLLTFLHNEKIVTHQLGWNNILIEPDEHYVVAFDWASAQSYLDGVPEKVRRDNISEVATSVIKALDGDVEDGTFPDDGEPAFVDYTNRLLSLARGEERNAHRAHSRFYELVDTWWPRGFHPFTTYPLT